MSKGSRNILVAAALVVTVAVLSWWLRPTQSAATLELVFLGYTNKPGAISTALLLATNTSRVPFEIRPWFHARNVVETNGEFFHVTGLSRPRR